MGHRNRLEAKALAVCDFLVHVEQVRTEEYVVVPRIIRILVLAYIAEYVIFWPVSTILSFTLVYLRRVILYLYTCVGWYILLSIVALQCLVCY